MASKTHVDNLVNERRLRPIYDSLDYGNNKKALQEADKVLKKQPGNQCARVLKALALLRLGKENECQVIMDKVRSEVPCEDSTLQAMSICYREIHQPDKISELYEAAAKADPNNEELLTHLFMSYVRLGDFKKQQHTALALYKLTPKNPYYFWAVMSVVMQAMQADDKLSKQVILPLAERMVLKLVNEGKMEAEQEVQLYLMILELQEKHKEMLQVLSGSLAHHLSSVPEWKARLLLRLKRYPEAESAYKKLISDNLDNWAYYQDFLTAALECETPSNCLRFLSETATTVGTKTRAPYLAQFELLKRTYKTDNPCSLDPLDLMLQYFTKFGAKGCIVGDLRLYLHLLSSVDKKVFLEKIEEEIGITVDEYPTSKEQMQKHIHLEQLRRICGFHHNPLADAEKRKKLVQRLCDLYEKGNALCPVEDRLPTDFCPADSYIILATHLLHQLWFETKEATHLYRIMLLLEKSLLTSPANFNIKILLVRAYLEAGLIAAADYTFSLLDAKHIQVDSLGHLAAPLLAPLGHLTQASATLDHSAKFFIANYKDSADHLTFAYKYGSFLKIQEFVDLRQRLEHSLHFAMTTVDKMLLELSWSKSVTTLFSTLSNMHIQPHEDSIRWNLLRDNRDLDVVIGWEPLTENEEDSRMRSETRECMLRLLEARNLMLRILAATNTDEADSSALLSRLSQELFRLDREEIPALLSKFEKENQEDKVDNVLIPMDAITRLRETYNSQQLKTVAKLADSLSQGTYLNAYCIEFLEASPSILSLPVVEQENPISYRNILLRASTCGETIAILTAMCTTTASSIKSQTTQKKNKKKQNKEIVASDSDQCRTNWLEMNMLLSERLRDLELTLTKLEKIQIHTGLNDGDEMAETILDRAQTSIVQSCRTLKNRASNTLKLLNSWKS